MRLSDFDESLLATFPKNCFAAIFGGNLEFSNENEKLISQTVQGRAISMEFFTPRIYAECTGDFSAIFGGQLKFLHKNAFISKNGVR